MQWQRDVSVALSKVGEVQQKRGDIAAAWGAFEALLAAAQALAGAEPDNARWQTDLVVGYAKLQGVTDDPGERRVLLGEALAIFKRLDGEGRLAADQDGRIAWAESELAALE